MMEGIYGREATALFCEMNAFKYRMRAGRKDDLQKDLGKEDWYLKRAASLRNPPKVITQATSKTFDGLKFIVDGLEYHVLENVRTLPDGEATYTVSPGLCINTGDNRRTNQIKHTDLQKFLDDNSIKNWLAD